MPKLSVSELVGADGVRKSSESWNVTNASFRASAARCVTRDGRECLQVDYPRGSYKPSSDREGGLGFYASPRGQFPADEAELRYSVLFDEGWDWAKGGKLPGLYVSRSAGAPGASGGHVVPDAATCRVMWRAGGAAEAYVYLPSNGTRHLTYRDIPGLVQGGGAHGDSLWRGLLRLHAGAWNDVAMRLRLNSFDKAGQARTDGGLELTVNGVTRRFDKLVWRTTPDGAIQGVVFHTFFGGGDPSWATPRDARAWFSNVHVSKVSRI